MNELSTLDFSPPSVGQLLQRIHHGYSVDGFNTTTVGLGALFYASLLTAGLSPRLRKPALVTALVSGLSTVTQSFFFGEDPPIA